MYKIIAAFLISLICSVTVLADTVKVNPDYPDQYVVKKGDTLWDIAGKFLLEPWRWPDIWHANPQIANPHLIYPGDVVSLLYKDGQPIITVSRSGQLVSGRTVKLSPTVRSYEKDDAIPTIPIESIKQFLTRPLIVSEEEMEIWPYVVSNFEKRLYAGTGDKIFVRGLDENNSGARYSVYRKGKAYVNPLKDEGNVLGYEALYVGEAVIDKPGDPASAIVAKSNREVLAGDRLTIESEDVVETNFMPSSPANNVEGNIISVHDGVAEIGRYQIVVVDLGTEDGMEVGNVLGIFQSGEIVEDEIATAIKAREECEKDIEFEYADSSVTDRMLSAIANDIKDNKCAFDRTALVKYLGRPNTEPELIELPEEYAGVLMVFRTFNKVSYALVMEATSNIHIYDTVRNL